jgi:hypothetical protein
MMNLGLAFLFSALTFNASALPAPRPDPALWILSPEGYGPIHPGMSKFGVEKVAGPIIDDPYPLPDCEQITLSDNPNVTLLIREGMVTRITIRDIHIKTDRGIGIGASQADVERQYSPVEIKPHQYTQAPAHYLTYWAIPEEAGIRFETDTDQRVNLIHVGNEDIRLVEGCA